MVICVIDLRLMYSIYDASSAQIKFELRFPSTLRFVVSFFFYNENESFFSFLIQTFETIVSYNPTLSGLRE